MLKVPRKLLLPGQYCVTDQPVILETLVGSCVALCIYNRRHRFSAMNHFILDRPKDCLDADVGRYGTTSTDRIIHRLLEQDDQIGHYEGMIFGGAAVLATGERNFDVGKKNLEAAMEIVNRYRLRIVLAETCGNRGRRIRFNTEDHTIECRFCGDIRGKRAG